MLLPPRTPSPLPPQPLPSRQAAAQALLQDKQAAAAAQLHVERSQFGDLNAFLRHSLAAETARADGLQHSLADALARLEAAQSAAAAAAAAAEEQRATEAAAALAALEGQRERMQQVGAGRAGCLAGSLWCKRGLSMWPAQLIKHVQCWFLIDRNRVPLFKKRTSAPAHRRTPSLRSVTSWCGGRRRRRLCLRRRSGDTTSCRW